MEKIQALLELERRGKLPAQFAPALAEARKRGLVPGGEEKPAEKSVMQTIKENILGDDDDTTQNTGEKIGSFINKAGEAMTFGLVGDEASAAAAAAIPGGRGYDEQLAHERQQEEILERDNPGAALGAEIGGGVLGAFLPGGAIGTLGKGAGMVPRIAASTAAGAGMGGVYGFAEGEGDERLSSAQTGAIFGAGAGAIAPVAAAGVKKVADSLVGNRAIRRHARGAPTSDALKREGSGLYDQIDSAGVQIKPQAFDNTRAKIMQSLQNETGFDDLPGPGSLTPKSARTMQIMSNASDEMAAEPTAALPFKAVDKMRRQAGVAAGDFTNKTDQSAGMSIIEGLDNFIQKLSPDDVVAGDLQTLKTAIPKARDTWARMSRSQKLDDAMNQSENYLSGGASAVRNKFASLLRNPKMSAGFSEAEKKAMQKVVQGSLPKVILDYLGSGLGMTAQIGAGVGFGGAPGAIAGMATAGASRRASEALTMKQAEIARALVANGTLKSIPKSPESVRRVTESLSRRIGAGVPQ